MNFLPPQSKYPKSLFIENETYKIRFVKNLKNFGETDPEKKEIRIKKGMSKRETFSTFIHECLHMIEFEANVDMSHKVVYDLEDAIFKLLVDNFL